MESSGSDDGQILEMHSYKNIEDTSVCKEKSLIIDFGKIQQTAMFEL